MLQHDTKGQINCIKLLIATCRQKDGLKCKQIDGLKCKQKDEFKERYVGRQIDKKKDR